MRAQTPDEKAAKKIARAEKRAARQARANERQQATAAKLAELNMNARFEGWNLSGGRLSKGLVKNHDVAGAVADFQHGANIGSRITVTRLALTRIFAFGDRKSVVQGMGLDLAVGVCSLKIYFFSLCC